MIDWQAITLTFRLAWVTTFLLLLLGIPLAHWLAFSRFRLKAIAEALIAMPLVLPPTVLGFYLLVAFSPSSGLGKWLKDVLGLQLIFSFEGLVLASIIYSLPFMVQPIQAGFASLPANLREAAATLGKSRLSTLLYVLLPNIKSSLLTAVVLTFAHTVGEFGVVLMIGGSIPGQTQVASIAIYEEVESMNYAAAHAYSLLLFGLSFLVLITVYLLNGNNIINRWK